MFDEILLLRMGSFMCILQIVEASVNVGLRMLRNVFSEEAGGYVEVFGRLGERGVITLETSEGMQRLACL
ncbi:MAG TPA: hypothetical protein ENF55_03950 [Thermoprotei archaeon]|nr:hypothetical protein [Thermoprotei archaeon]